MYVIYLPYFSTGGSVSSYIFLQTAPRHTHAAFTEEERERERERELVFNCSVCLLCVCMQQIKSSDMSAGCKRTNSLSFFSAAV